jgi:hypothetical protein
MEKLTKIEFCLTKIKALIQVQQTKKQPVRATKTPIKLSKKPILQQPTKNHFRIVKFPQNFNFITYKNED